MSLYAKALAALLGGIAAWGVTASSDGVSAPEWFGLVGALGTALAVYAAPYAPSDPKARDDAGLTLVELLVGGLLLLVLAAVLFGRLG